MLHKLLNKNIMISLPRTNLPVDLTSYKVDLIVDQYQDQQGTPSQQVYFRFTKEQEEFQIRVDDCFNVNSSIHLLQIQGEEATLGNAVDLKLRTHVKGYKQPQLQVKKAQLQQADKDSLGFQEGDAQGFDFGSQQGQSSDEMKQPLMSLTQHNRGKIKQLLLVYLQTEQNRFAPLKYIKVFLQSKGFDISDRNIKNLLGQICESSVADKKRGYQVKEQFMTTNQLRQKQQQEKRLSEEQEKVLQKMQKREEKAKKNKK